ncbi:MAG: glycosyltransferase [Thauera sp.]|nr:MAG: glycosyltransferase [Rhodocyclaceae bacterium]
MSKRILIVAAEFPPVKGIGRLRPLKFCQHLQALGWECAVLTVEIGDVAPIDLETLKEIPLGVQVYRARLPKPKAFLVEQVKKILRRPITQSSHTSTISTAAQPADEPLRPLGGMIEKAMAWWDHIAKHYVLIPDDLLLWKRSAVHRGLEAIASFRPDVILATAPCFTDLLVGHALSARAGVPWVADYRDLWTGDVLREWVPKWRQVLELALERHVLHSASAILAVSEPKTRVLSNRLGGGDRFYTLTNGYDEDEFDAVTPEVTMNGPIRVVYAGRLFKNRRGYEIMEAVGELVADRPDLKRAIRFEYYGGIEPEIKKTIDEMLDHFSIREAFHFSPDVPYARSKALQKGADALLLIVDSGETSSGVIPGKLFEYMAAGQPILCIATPGATTDIIERGGLGWSVAPGDIQSLQGILRSWLDSGRPAVRPNRAYLQQFERSSIVTRLSEVLSGVIVSDRRS